MYQTNVQFYCVTTTACFLFFRREDVRSTEKDKVW